MTIRRQLQFSRHALVQKTCRKKYHSLLNLQEEVSLPSKPAGRSSTPFLTWRNKYHSLLNLQEEVPLPS
jgi:hypothetical protein